VLACFVCEPVMTFMFVLIIHGATDSRAPQSLAGTEIGFGFLLFCLGSEGAIQTLSLLG
jgi:aquaporin Z